MHGDSWVNGRVDPVAAAALGDGSKRLRRHYSKVHLRYS